MKRVLILSFYFLLFIGHLQAQPYRLRVDSLKVDHKFYIGATDRFGFFSFLNASNQLQGSTGLAAGSVYNDRLLAPYISFAAGDGLYGSGGQIQLGNTLLLQVNVDNSSLEITNDTLNVKAGGITGSHILNGTIQNEDITNPNILFSAGDGLYGSGGQIDLGGSILFQVNVDDSTITIINDTLHVLAGAGGTLDTAGVRGIVSDSMSAYFPVTNANLQNSSLTVTAGDGLTGGGAISLGGSANLDVSVDNSTVEIAADAIQVKDLGITNAKLAGSIGDSKLSTITTSEKVAGSAVQLSATGALENATGLNVRVDNSYIGKSSNNLTILDESITAAKIQDGGIIYDDLSAALKDSIAGNGTKNITYNYNGFTKDTTVSFYIGSTDTFSIDISGWSFTSPVVQAVTEYDGYYAAVIKSISANYLVIRAKAYGFNLVYDDSAKITVGVNEQ
ncbi:MAG: hypothetical protein KC713_03780 [Candidatus Omnitrophica bacterium]|nr:hypothetical protein [Candidatus Omnitrophota bacterium]